MSDSFQTSEHTGFFGRIVESIKGVLVGLLLIALAFVGLFWNEGRAVQTAKSLDEGASAVVEVSADEVDDAHDGELVAVSGEATTDETLRDGAFGLEVEALALERHVEMYQWVEKKKTRKKKKLGGGEEKITTYTYEREWTADEVDSSKFEKPDGHRNPSMPYEAASFYTEEAKLGAFDLPVRLVKRIDDGEDVDAEKAEELPDEAEVRGGKVVTGEDGSPEVGDLRVWWTKVTPTTITVVAQQDGDTFAPFPTDAGDDIELLELGEKSADAMFEKAQDDNEKLTWIIRFVGWLFMVIGLGLVFRPISTVADVIPLFGSLLGAGIFLFALLMGSVFSSITVAVAWIVYRPLIGGLLLAVGIGLFFLLFGAGRRARARA